MTARYLPDAEYDALVAALLTVEPCAVTGLVTGNEIKIALGEHGDVWPESIRPTVARAALKDFLIDRNALH